MARSDRVSPQDLAALIARQADGLVVGIDVDGVLAPIVVHADQARLLAGVGDVLVNLGMHLPIAVVSGRSLANLESQFGFPTTVEVIGSHGLEWRSGGVVHLDDAERQLLDQLTRLADETVRVAGEGAWRETKPASVVVHVRQAHPRRAEQALQQLRTRLDGVTAWSKEGHAVVELMAVATSKATAMHRFRDLRGARTMVFIGDDRTDEEVFEASAPSDITVRVGDGVTSARFRLPDPMAVRAVLQHLASLTQPGK